MSVAGATACVTVMVRVGAPGAVTVIVPVLELSVVFSVTLILNDPLPVRFVGWKLETVNHDVALLVAFHVWLEITLMVAKLAVAVGFHVVCDIVSVAGAASCVTVINRVDAPGAVTVIVPVLVLVSVFAVALILKDPFPVRFVG